MLCLRAVQADPVPVTAPGQECATTRVLETTVLTALFTPPSQGGPEGDQAEGDSTEKPPRRKRYAH